MAGKKRPKVGVAVLVFKDNKVLLGKRKSAHGAGEYASPGGHLEYWESIEQCAKRECLEEERYGKKHYLDIGLVADWASGTPKVMEPKKCAGWDWYDLNEVPGPLFGAIWQSFEALRTGKNFFDE